MFSKIKPDLTAVQLSFVAPLTWEWRTSLWIYKGYIRIQTKISYQFFVYKRKYHILINEAQKVIHTSDAPMLNK